jgi:hypothetical protein
MVLSDSLARLFIMEVPLAVNVRSEQLYLEKLVNRRNTFFHGRRYELGSHTAANIRISTLFLGGFAVRTSRMHMGGFELPDL